MDPNLTQQIGWPQHCFLLSNELDTPIECPLVGLDDVFAALGDVLVQGAFHALDR
jgi:hypothetical protein